MTEPLILAAEGPVNPLIPAVYDIVWSAVCLAIIGFVFWKKVLPLFQKVLAERTEKIEGGIARAEAAQAEASRKLEEYKEQLAEARAEAARIRDDARAEGQQIVEEMRDRAQAEYDRIVAHGHNELDAHRARIVSELRADLGRVAVDLAGKVVGESLEDQALRRGTVDRFLNELDAAAAPAAK